ncbi:ribonuclease G [Thioalkalivibrio sp. XN279]|uniref:ribonuclease G n=1 Tax=Thioalkalivibrio sp. XN279 TaxID=2714953 RepID=UPI00140E5001|nr:ribonuclease G [Thioalkalivibrio sp. XN279]
MSEEILVNVNPRETRAALLENGVVQEVFIERDSRRGLTGNVYKGRVRRVLPGMQAAFVDIGLERTAFLHASDILRAEEVVAEGLEPAAEVGIRDLLVEGQEILVQVVKDPLGSKGARLTTFVTIPSRYLVYLPFGSGIGVSARIDEETERARLRDIMADIVTGPGGWIVRTAAEGAPRDALRADMIFLCRLWEAVSRQGRTAAPGTLVHADLDLSLRLLRDLLAPRVERVRVDDADAYARMKRFATTFIPEMAPKIEMYAEARPIFDLHGVEDEIVRALERKVPLKSGGYLVIDQTEAMTTIDVNTGAYVGHRNLEETIFRTNLEAAQAIARQVRLRNLGGIIIVDFIDMEEEEHREQVLAALERALQGDHARNQITEVSRLGLVEMTRKRTRESLEHVLCHACPSCRGRGSVKTPETVCYEIFRDILRQARQFDFQELLVLAHAEVLDLLVDEEAAGLAELESLTGKPIRLQAESGYSHDQYDVVPI